MGTTLGMESLAVSYSYRCNKCRTRNTFRQPLEHYVRPRKCKCCGHRRFYFDKERNRRQPCRCDGGLLGRSGSIPHRPGSPCCVLNPMHPYHRARVQGAPADFLMDLFIDLAWEGEGGRVTAPGDPVPF